MNLQPKIFLSPIAIGATLNHTDLVIPFPTKLNLTVTNLKEFQERSLADFMPFAVFLDTISRDDEACLVALGVDVSGQKMALGCWQGSFETHEICESAWRAPGRDAPAPGTAPV